MSKLLCLFVLALSFIRLNGQSEYKKLSINEAIAIGLINNQEINKAKNFISAAKGRFWSGVSLPQPEVGVSFEYAPVNSSLSNYSERTIEINQSFEFPSNYFLKGSRLNKEEEITFLKLKQTELLVTSEIKAAYYNVLAMEKQLTIAEENRSIAEDFSKKAEIRYNVGEGTNIERLTAKVQLTESFNNLESTKNNLRNAFAQLNYALGKGENGDDIYTLTDSLNFNPEQQPVLSLEELNSISLSDNQSIKISELNLSTSSIDRSLAWSSLLPDFNIGYFRQSRDGNNGYYGASFGMSVPLWFMFDNRGRIQEASANTNIAESDLQLVKNDVYLKLKNAYGHYENDLRQVQLYHKEILPQVEEIYRAAATSYDAGEITYLEFLQARQTFIGARSNYIKVLYDYNLSIYAIEILVGQDIEKLNGVK